MNNLVAELIGDYKDLEVAPEYVESLDGFSFLRGGVILWLIYKSANKGYDAAKQLTDAAQNFVGNKPA